MKETKRSIKRKKQGTNFFVKYLSTSALAVFIGFLILALVMVFFIAVQWWTDKVDVLSRNADDIVAVCEEMKMGDIHDEELITSTLRIMSQATQSDYFITDKKGDSLFCGDCETGEASQCENHKSMLLADEILQRAINGGFSDYMTDETFGMGRFVVAKPVLDENSEVICVVFAVEDAITGLVPYVARIADRKSVV